MKRDPAVLGELLPELVLGTLADADRSEVETALAASPALRRELDLVREALAAAALGLDPVEPAVGARLRLMDALDGPERFAAFFEPLSRLLDLSVARVRDVLARIDDGAAWTDGLPGMKLIDFAVGQRLGAADAGLVRLEPGASFPRHRHLGEEVTMVLEGTMIDDGAACPPGTVVKHELDSVHGYAASVERPLVILVLHHGIEPV